MLRPFLVAFVALGTSCGDDRPRDPDSHDGVFTEELSLSRPSSVDRVTPNCYVLTSVRMFESSLHDLRGLEHVTAIDRLTIESNAELESLDGLEGLVRLGSLRLVNNPALRSISALSGIDGSLLWLETCCNGLETLVGLHHVSDVSQGL